MPRSEICIGFVGSGRIEKRNAYNLLRDYIDAQGGSVKAILPLTKSYWNENLGIVANFLVENDIPLEAVVDSTTAKLREIKPFLSVARKQHQTTAVAHKMASLLKSARVGNLIVLWEDEDDNVHDAVRAAHDSQITLLELTNGLDHIDLDIEDDQEEEPISDEAEMDETDEDEEEFEDEDADDDAESDEEDLEEDEDDLDEDAEEDLEEEAEDDLEEEDSDGEEEDDSEEEFEDSEEEFEDSEEEDNEEMLSELLESDDAMTDFQTKLIEVLERAVVALERTAFGDSGAPAKPAVKSLAPRRSARTAPSEKTAAPRPTKRTAKKTTTTAPAKTKAAPTKSEAPATKRRTTRKPAAAAASDNGTMSKAKARRILEDYRPRRGRPPAEVTEAKKVLGLA